MISKFLSSKWEIKISVLLRENFTLWDQKEGFSKELFFSLNDK